MVWASSILAMSTRGDPATDAAAAAAAAATAAAPCAEDATRPGEWINGEPTTGEDTEEAAERFGDGAGWDTGVAAAGTAAGFLESSAARRLAARTFAGAVETGTAATNGRAAPDAGVAGRSMTTVVAGRTVTTPPF